MNKRLFSIVLLLVAAMTASAQYPYVYLKMLLKDRTSYNMQNEFWDAAWIEVPTTHLRVV